ncbi:MAG: hypothetical protein KKF16_02775 [Euryarchaeota archaeon]|nr:hypothetical protein [Euryarchaeota archaeon]MBV1767092.1 hypothetical protein [Methanobacterium sp.]
MYVVIIDAGGLGLNLAKLLTVDGHDVTLLKRIKLPVKMQHQKWIVW